MEGSSKGATLAMAWSIFIICAMLIGVVLLVSFAINVPQYRYAAVLFIIMAIGMTIQRIVRLRAAGQDRPAER